MLGWGSFYTEKQVMKYKPVTIGGVIKFSHLEDIIVKAYVSLREKVIFNNALGFDELKGGKIYLQEDELDTDNFTYLYIYNNRKYKLKREKELRAPHFNNYSYTLYLLQEGEYRENYLEPNNEN